MSIDLIVVTLRHKSGLPEHDIVNNFVFEWPGAWDNVKAAVASDSLATFYNAAPTGQGTLKLAQYISDYVDRTPGKSLFKHYDVTNSLAGTPHGSPMLTENWTLGAVLTSGNNLPSEIAMVGSYHSAFGNLSEEAGAIRPKARRRGRIYVGPLTFDAVTMDNAAFRVKVKDTVRTMLAAAMNDLMNNPATNWCQWSRTNALALSVTGGFVDDAFDVQRRRGENAIARTTFGS